MHTARVKRWETHGADHFFLCGNGAANECNHFVLVMVRFVRVDKKEMVSLLFFVTFVSFFFAFTLGCFCCFGLLPLLFNLFSRLPPRAVVITLRVTEMR